MKLDAASLLIINNPKIDFHTIGQSANIAAGQFVKLKINQAQLDKDSLVPK
jgi:hypothetical protein